jgi:soluble lytic murein transglycosylase
MRFFLVVALLAPLLWAAHLKRFDYETIHRMPASIEKDYYIWRFLRQPDTTAQQARRIIKDVSRLNGKLKKAYRAKTGTSPRVKPKPLYYYKKIDKEKRLEKVQGEFAFQKALKLLKRNQIGKAKDYLYQSYRLFKKREKKDKALFWLYLVSKRRHHLQRLLREGSVDFYTLLAADILDEPYPADRIVVPNIKRKTNPLLDTNDPVQWAQIKYKLYREGVDLDALAQLCKSRDTVGSYCFIKEREENFRKSYFPLPYRDIMRRFPIERQALIYAIARQESRFVPGSVSRSFALGMMQIMPFLVDHIAKERGERIDYDEMFDPYKAIVYADHHLDYLTSFLYHPLFVAYAYNGGIGFTKKLLTRKRYFKKGPYEPYMSIETVPNLEAREYGKKVLTNYVIYLNLLGKPTRLKSFLDVLIDPEMTDRFRKKVEF